MKVISVDGLPEPVAQALEALVETLRGQFRMRAAGDRESVDAGELKAAILARRDASLAAGRDWGIGSS